MTGSGPGSGTRRTAAGQTRRPKSRTSHPLCPGVPVAALVRGHSASRDRLDFPRQRRTLSPGPGGTRAYASRGRGARSGRGIDERLWARCAATAGETFSGSQRPVCCRGRDGGCRHGRRPGAGGTSLGGTSLDRTSLGGTGRRWPVAVSCRRRVPSWAVAHQHSCRHRGGPGRRTDPACVERRAAQRQQILLLTARMAGHDGPPALRTGGRGHVR